jgi:hypothetical protein
MYVFLSETRNAENNEPALRATNSYIEIEVPFDDEEVSIFMYIIPRNKHSAFVAICLGDMFDEMVEDIDKDSFDTIKDTWPTLACLMINGINDKYQNGALIKLEDADYGDNKWFVASIAGNISFDSEEELFCDRTKESMATVLATTSRLLSELQERKPSMLRAIGKGIMAGLGIGVFTGVAQALGININLYDE